MKHFNKAEEFHTAGNWSQALRHIDAALTKLKQLKDRSLATIEILDDALTLKFDALNFVGQTKEAKECATEKYNLWATNHMRNPRMIEAAFPLIDVLLDNGDFDQAQVIASTVYEMAMHPTNHDIPDHLQQPYLAQAAHLLAHATILSAQNGDIPPEEMNKAGEEAIALARKAIEIHTQLHGPNSKQVVSNTCILAGALDCFSKDSNDEAVRLYEQVIACRSRTEGSTSINVAVGNQNLGNTHVNRAKAAVVASDLARALASWDLALSHFREAARIFRINNHLDGANEALACIAEIERNIRLARSPASSTRG